MEIISRSQEKATIEFLVFPRRMCVWSIRFIVLLYARFPFRVPMLTMTSTDSMAFLISIYNIFCPLSPIVVSTIDRYLIGILTSISKIYLTEKP